MGTINDYIVKNEADLNIIIDGPGCFDKPHYMGPLGGVPENLRDEEVLAKSWSIGHQMHVLTINQTSDVPSTLIEGKPMITPLQLTRKITELETEFRKVLDGGDISAAYIWVLYALDFAETVMDETRDSKFNELGEDEKIDFANALLSLRGIHKDMLLHYQQRERRKNT